VPDDVRPLEPDVVHDAVAVLGTLAVVRRR